MDLHYNSSMAEVGELLKDEVGEIRWRELQPHFARGVVLQLSPELGLLDVATEFVADNKTRVEQWLDQQQIRRVDDDQARGWAKANPVFTAIVVAPWVLIQEPRH